MNVKLHRIYDGVNLQQVNLQQNGEPYVLPHMSHPTEDSFMYHFNSSLIKLDMDE